MSNNPPDVELGLTMKQAQFLLNNCESNMQFALNAMMQPGMSSDGLHKLVNLNEQFKEIRELLKAQGVTT